MKKDRFNIDKWVIKYGLKREIDSIALANPNYSNEHLN